jgi:hypothetical protein
MAQGVDPEFKPQYLKKMFFHCDNGSTVLNLLKAIALHTLLFCFVFGSTGV